MTTAAERLASAGQPLRDRLLDPIRDLPLSDMETTAIDWMTFNAPIKVVLMVAHLLDRARQQSAPTS